MSSKKFTVYCNILEYIKDNDADFYEIIMHTCTNMSLAKSRSKYGITLLWPQDPKVKKEISDLATSINSEGLQKAAHMINALIIRDTFKSVSDWERKKDDIPNSLYPSQHVAIKSVGAKEVVFESGAKAVLDENFKDGSERANLSVWKLVSGSIPVTTDKPASGKYIKAAKKSGKTGGYEVTASIKDNIRFKIAIAIENTYLFMCTNPTMALSKSMKNGVFYKYTVSLLHYILSRSDKRDDLLARALPLFTGHNVDLYFMIQPHTFDGEYLLPTSVIEAWWNDPARETVDIPKAVSEIENYYSRLASTGAAVFADRQKLYAEIDIERRRLIDILASAGRNILGAIDKVYSALENDNKIGSVSNVYPEGLHEHYRANPKLKLVQDDLRFMTYHTFCVLESGPFDQGLYNEMLHLIGSALNANTSAAREHVLNIMNKMVLMQSIQPSEHLNEIRVFINSSAFLQMPCLSSDTSTHAKSTGMHPNPNVNIYYNIDGALRLKHQRVLNEQGGPAKQQKMLSDGELADILRSLKKETLSAELLGVLEKLM